MGECNIYNDHPSDVSIIYIILRLNSNSKICIQLATTQPSGMFLDKRKNIFSNKFFIQMSFKVSWLTTEILYHSLFLVTKINSEYKRILTTVLSIKVWK